jgi:hypothetical protein
MTPTTSQAAPAPTTTDRASARPSQGPSLDPAAREQQRDEGVTPPQPIALPPVVEVGPDAPEQVSSSLVIEVVPVAAPHEDMLAVEEAQIAQSLAWWLAQMASIDAVGVFPWPESEVHSGVLIMDGVDVDVQVEVRPSPSGRPQGVALTWSESGTQIALW